MANMFPAILRPETQSSAERVMYELFESDLDDSYNVFHSVWWQSPKGRGTRDGEIDFLIVHLQKGVLALEVKGGRIRYDGDSDKWFSNNNSITDPVHQAVKAKHTLIGLLRDRGALSDRWVTFGHGVIFPDIYIEEDLRLDLPQEIIIDSHDLSNLKKRIDQIFGHYENELKGDGAPGRAVVHHIRDILAPAWDLRPRLGDALKYEEKQIQRLTMDQFNILGFIGAYSDDIDHLFRTMSTT